MYNVIYLVLRFTQVCCGNKGCCEYEGNPWLGNVKCAEGEGKNENGE